MLAVWSLIPLPFLNPACSCGSSQFTYCWSLAWIRLFLIVFLKYIKFRNSEAYSRLRRRNMFEASADFDSQVFTWTLAQLNISSLSYLESVWSHSSSSSHFSDFSCLKTAQCIQDLFLNWKLNNPKWTLLSCLPRSLERPVSGEIWETSPWTIIFFLSNRLTLLPCSVFLTMWPLNICRLGVFKIKVAYVTKQLYLRSAAQCGESTLSREPKKQALEFTHCSWTRCSPRVGVGRGKRPQTRADGELSVALKGFCFGPETPVCSSWPWSPSMSAWRYA